MDRLLVVPIQLDAMYTDGSVSLAAAHADFTRLPYLSHPDEDGSFGDSDPDSDDPDAAPPPPPLNPANSSQVFLGSSITRPPSPVFSGDRDVWKPPAGLHLHWALPDALCTQRADPDSPGCPRFPKVPNRWLIRLSFPGTARPEQSWVIESDYLHPPGADARVLPQNTICFPIVPPRAFDDILQCSKLPSTTFPSPPELSAHPFLYQAPFRAMGRQLSLEGWVKSKAGEYLEQKNRTGLTAVGYGHPQFAAIYSNCMSVFGFHHPPDDSKYPRRYDLIGWYAEPRQDCLSLFQSAGADPWNALQAEYDWVCSKREGALPRSSVYVSRLELGRRPDPSLPNSRVAVAVGNTGTEALSAHLAGLLTKDSDAQASLLEEQLEAIHLLPHLTGESVDLGAKFQEARHYKGFKKLHGGTLWSVRARGREPSESQSQVSLPSGLAHLLNRVNLAQESYEKVWQEIESVRDHLFADWVRLESQRVEHPNHAILPGAEAILDYSTESALKPLQEKLADAGRLDLEKGADGRWKVSWSAALESVEYSPRYTFARGLGQALREIQSHLELYNQSPAARAEQLELYLVRKEAPRYYQPHDPAVLLEGPAVVATRRYGQEKQLECSLLENHGGLDLSSSLRRHGTRDGWFATILRHLDGFSSSQAVGFSAPTDAPWNPVSLEWEADLYPEPATGPDGGYEPDELMRKQELEVNQPDLRWKAPPAGLAGSAPHAYTGQSLLSSHALTGLQHSLSAYLLSLSLSDLKQWGLAAPHLLTPKFEHSYDLALLAWFRMTFGLAPDFLNSLKDPEQLKPEEQGRQQTRLKTWLDGQFPFSGKGEHELVLVGLPRLRAILQGWSSRPRMLAPDQLGTLVEPNQDPVYTAMQAYLEASQRSFLCQTLGGFHDALLTQSREMQLPVWDWRVLGSEEETAYVRSVRQCLGEHRKAPLMFSQFLPFRSGLMQVTRLTLVDSFGQVLPLDFHPGPQVRCAEGMGLLAHRADQAQGAPVTAEEDRSFIYLPPRLSQPAQLSFRWLAADQGDFRGHGDEAEMNDHPASSPICGWLLGNHVSGGLEIYGQDGTALGSLVPGQTEEAFQLVWQAPPGTHGWRPISAVGNVHLRRFLENLAGWASSPERWAGWLENLDLALEKIDPQFAAHNSALAVLIGRPMALVRARVAVRTMGLLAVDQSPGTFSADLTGRRRQRSTRNFEQVDIPLRLGSPQLWNDGLVAFWVEDGQGGYREAQPTFPELSAQPLSLSLSDTPLSLLMLVDPRGAVHATTGILPVKALGIPPDQYSKALTNLSVTFPCAPILTGLERVELPLASEVGYGWTWLDRPGGSSWNQVTRIEAALPQAKYDKQRLLEGWLKLSPQAKKDLS